MAKLNVHMPDGRLITISNLKGLHIKFCPKQNLFLLKYSDDSHKSHLICSHENFGLILYLHEEINRAHNNGKFDIRLIKF